MVPMRSFFLSLLVLSSACRLTDHSEREVSTADLDFPVSGYEDVDPKDLPQITFDSVAVSMGRILQGQRVERIFAFNNTGGAPLVISDVRGTCGCTVGKDWPKDPVPPGKGGTITVTFDSEGRSGAQHKTVTVLANSSPPSTTLTLTGEVVAPVPTK